MNASTHGMNLRKQTKRKRREAAARANQKKTKATAKKKAPKRKQTQPRPQPITKVQKLDKPVNDDLPTDNIPPPDDPLDISEEKIDVDVDDEELGIKLMFV